MVDLYLGVDVGTGSVRAGLFDAAGTLKGVGKHDIQIWRAAGERVEQSSDDIWAATCKSVKAALQAAGAKAIEVKGIGFDATCSLVLLDAVFQPVPVGPEHDAQRNVIVWMDHRAIAQAARINATGHRVLKYVGGAISPEMETPKLLWLKENLRGSYDMAAHFFDLSDWLTFRATGDLTRSTCALVCKWTWLAHEHRWDDSYLTEIGLGDLSHAHHARIGNKVVAPGTAVGAGLSEKAARDLGLVPGIKVAAALIDAHAGALATLGGHDAAGKPVDPRRRMALIMGTSACCMSLSPEEIHVDGLWGPYFDAITQGLWLTEGGMSAAGAALDRFLITHPLARGPDGRLKRGLFDELERAAKAAAPNLSEAALLARDVHILADVNGNRSPLADPEMRGVWSGIGLREDAASLLKLHVAALCGLAYGLADILDQQERCGLTGHDTIVISGGLGRSPLARQIIADATGRIVSLPATEEPVLLGAAMLGAVAAGGFASLEQGMAAMSRDAAQNLPAGGNIAAFHQAKRQVHQKMQALDSAARVLMQQSAAPRG